MKKKIVVLLSLVMILSTLLCACGKTEVQSAEFDKTVKMDNYEVVVNSDIVTATQLNGDQDHYEQFLTTDVTYGSDDSILCDITTVAKDGYILAVISYDVKNVSQKQQKLDMSIGLNYNNGYTYDDGETYYCFGTGGLAEWNLCDSGIIIEPLDTVHFKTSFTIPEEVFSNTEAPLKLFLDNYEFFIR